MMPTSRLQAHLSLESRTPLQAHLSLEKAESCGGWRETGQYQIARKAEAKWMLTGSILQSEPVLVLTSQLIDVSSGGVLASHRITGNEGENIFAVIDRLTEDVRKCSSLPAAMKMEPQVKLADVTTHSEEAYRCYLEGLAYSDKMYFADARNLIGPMRAGRTTRF